MRKYCYCGFCGLSPLETTFGERSSAFPISHEDFRKRRTRLSKVLLETRRDLHLATSNRPHWENEMMSSISPQMHKDDHRYGWVFLLIAERDAVHSLEIKGLLEASGAQNAQYRKLMVKKLTKAVATCRKLARVVENEAIATTKLEFYVYAALISGIYAVAKKRWARAIGAFSIARCGLEALCSKSERNEKEYRTAIQYRLGYSEETEWRFSRVLADKLFSTLVDPSLSLALSQSSAHGSSPGLRTISRRRARQSPVPWLAPAVGIIYYFLPDLFQDISEEGMPEGIPRDIKWRTHEAHIYNDTLAERLHETRTFDSKRWSFLVDIYYSGLAYCDSDDAERVQDGAILLTYLKYHMLFSRVKEHLLAVDCCLERSWFDGDLLTYDKDFSRLSSSIFSTIEEISALPGVCDDDELSQDLQRMSRVVGASLGAKKSMVIADAYAAVRKFPEALKLLLHAEEQMSGLKEDSVVESFPYGVVSSESVRELKARVGRHLTQAHIMAGLQSRESRESIVTEDIHQVPSFDSVYRMTDIDQHAKIQPVLCKAVLFDVACNYIGYSDAVERGANAVSAGEQTDKKKGGFFGFFGRP